MGRRQLYNQVPQTAWVSSSCSWNQLETRCQHENQFADSGLAALSDPRLSNSGQDEEEVLLWWREELWFKITVCPHLQLTSHTQPTSTLLRITCERYIFIKKCVRLFIEVHHYVWLCSAYICICVCMRLYNSPREWSSIPGPVIPKTQKMVLDAALLNTQHYRVRIKVKVEQSRERSSTSVYKQF